MARVADDDGARWGDPWRRLAAAVLLVAVQDARSRNKWAWEARRFLELCGADLAETALDIHPENFARWKTAKLVRSRGRDPEREREQGRARGARYRESKREAERCKP